MENADIIKTLNRLMDLPFENLYNELEKYSVEMLELFAVNIYNKSLRQKHVNDIFNHILFKRYIKLNDNFQWTDENKHKLLNINDKFMQVFESAYNEALSIAYELENRIKNNDKFIKDYEIVIKINPYMSDNFYDETSIGFGFVLSEPLLFSSPIEYPLGHPSCDYKLIKKPIYLDKTWNWNIEYFDGIFDDKYICYQIHELLDKKWSFNDIISIARICADIEVMHQHYIEI